MKITVFGASGKTGRILISFPFKEYDLIICLAKSVKEISLTVSKYFLISQTVMAG